MTDDCVADVLSTCKLFTRVLVSVGARFVSEAVTCIYNTLAIRARFTRVPPAVHRRVEVTPLGGPVTCRRRFVQPKPVFIARPAVHAHNIMILLPWSSRRFLRLNKYLSVCLETKNLTQVMSLYDTDLWLHAGVQPNVFTEDRIMQS